MLSLLRRLRAADCDRGRRVPDPEACAGVGCEARSLAELPVGASGRVSCLAEPGSPAGRKLAGMGFLPGAAVEVVQRRPVYVLRTGRSEFAVDAELARLIRVDTDPPRDAATD